MELEGNSGQSSHFTDGETQRLQGTLPGHSELVEREEGCLRWRPRTLTQGRKDWLGGMWKNQASTPKGHLHDQGRPALHTITEQCLPLTPPPPDSKMYFLGVREERRQEASWVPLW